MLLIFYLKYSSNADDQNKKRREMRGCNLHEHCHIIKNVSEEPEKNKTILYYNKMVIQTKT